MQIALASDHAGFDYKERLKLLLIESGHHVHDFGTDSEAPVDYPVVIRPLAEAVGRGDLERGIILGGSGNGEAIVANRIHGVRCALCWSPESARLARQHNDANVLSLGQRLLDYDDVIEIVECWLETPFEGGRHLWRIRMIDRQPGSTGRVESNGRFPHRTAFVEEGSYICESCREEFVFPVDISAGPVQNVVEECPVCCHENLLSIEIDDEGDVLVLGDRHATG